MAFLEQLGYAAFEVSDLAAWEKFASNVLGMHVKPGALAGTLLLQMDDHPYRIILIEGPADDIAIAGWRARDAAALDAFAAHLEASGVPYAQATKDELTLRGVDQMIHFVDPIGARHEAYIGGAQGGETFVSPQLRNSPYVTGIGGLGHLVYGSRDYAASIKFAIEVLGMSLSDTIDDILEGGIPIDVTFLHLNERHHSVAYANLAHPTKRLHHFMVEIAKIDEVGRARDRHLAEGLAVDMDIGQHPNDRMISYYGRTPSGFLVEFGWGGVIVDDAVWQTTHYPQLSEWGHRPYGK